MAGYGRKPDQNKFLANLLGFTGDAFEEYGGFGDGGFGRWHNDNGIANSTVNQAIGVYQGTQALKPQLDEFKDTITQLTAERQDFTDLLKGSKEMEDKLRRQLLLGSTSAGGAEFGDVARRFQSSGRSRGGGVGTNATTQSGINFLT